MITIIPFKVLDIAGEGFHLLIKILINKKVAKVIIDTGASKTVFDNQRIKKYVGKKTFEKHDSLSTGLGTSTMTSELVSIKKIKIGELEIVNYKTILLDLSHVNNSYEQIKLKAVDGVLGSDLLLKYSAVIDYDKKILKLKFPKKK
jgi:Aspartyl protease